MSENDQLHCLRHGSSPSTAPLRPQGKPPVAVVLMGGLDQWRYPQMVSGNAIENPLQAGVSAGKKYGTEWVILSDVRCFNRENEEENTQFGIACFQTKPSLSPKNGSCP